MVGTASGNILYVNFKENVLVKLICRVCQTPESIDSVNYDQTNQHIMMVTCGKNSGDSKVYTSSTLD